MPTDPVAGMLGLWQGWPGTVYRHPSPRAAHPFSGLLLGWSCTPGKEAASPTCRWGLAGGPAKHCVCREGVGAVVGAANKLTLSNPVSPLSLTVMGGKFEALMITTVGFGLWCRGRAGGLVRPG